MADIDSLKEEYRNNLTQCMQRVKTELDNKASADDLTELQEQVNTIETNLHTHDNKDVLDLLTATEEGKLQYNGTTIGGDGGASTADAVEYVNDVISSNNVEEALNKLIDKIYYIAPQISSFTASPTGGVFEIGTTVTAPITFNWLCNKDITTQTLTDCILTDNTVRTASYDTDITSNKTFTLTVSDGENSASKIIGYTFVSPYYVGVSDTDALDETGIKALTKKVEVGGAKTISYTNSQNYMVFAYPSSYGTIKKVTDINGFDVTSSFKLSNVTVNSVNYNVYVSNKVTGTFKMTFSI